MPSRLLFAWLVAVLVRPYLSDFLKWLDGLGTGSQGLVLILLAVAVGLAWDAFKGAVRWLTATVAARWREKRAASDAEDQRLTPQQKMPLLQATAAQIAAVEMFHQAVAGMTEPTAVYHANSNRVVAKMNAASAAGSVSQAQSKRLMEEMAGVIDQYSAAISKDALITKRSMEMLDDAWSSRMYWHDARNTASDILDPEIPVTVGTMLRKIGEARSAFSGAGDKLTGVAGWTDKLDRSVAKYQKVLAQLIAAFDEGEKVCHTVLRFHRDRTGWRGVVRRLFRRKR